MRSSKWLRRWKKQRGRVIYQNFFFLKLRDRHELGNDRRINEKPSALKVLSRIIFLRAQMQALEVSGAHRILAANVL